MARETMTMTLAGIEAEILYDGKVSAEIVGRSVVFSGGPWQDRRRFVVYRVPADAGHTFVDALLGIFPTALTRPHSYHGDLSIVCLEAHAEIEPGPFSWRDLLPWNWSKPPVAPEHWVVRAVYDEPGWDVGRLTTAPV